MADESTAPFPLEVNLNPWQEMVSKIQMRLKCFIGTIGNNDYKAAFTNIFYINI